MQNTHSLAIAELVSAMLITPQLTETSDTQLAPPDQAITNCAAGNDNSISNIVSFDNQNSEPLDRTSSES